MEIKDTLTLDKESILIQNYNKTQPIINPNRKHLNKYKKEYKCNQG